MNDLFDVPENQLILDYANNFTNSCMYNRFYLMDLYNPESDGISIEKARGSPDFDNISSIIKQKILNSKVMGNFTLNDYMEQYCKEFSSFSGLIVNSGQIKCADYCGQQPSERLRVANERYLNEEKVFSFIFNYSDFISD